MNTRPATDSAGGHSMLLQYKVIRVTHLMMTKATMGPQWNTRIRLVEDIVAGSSLFPSFIFCIQACRTISVCLEIATNISESKGK